MINGNMDCEIRCALYIINSIETSKDRRNAMVYRLKSSDNFWHVSPSILSHSHSLSLSLTLLFYAYSGRLEFVNSSWSGCTSEPIMHLSVLTTY